MRYVLHSVNKLLLVYDDWDSKLGNEELDSGLERSFLSSFDKGIAEISTNSETVSAALPVSPLISRGELSATKDLISLRLEFSRELGVNITGVDQDWDSCGRVFLEISWVLKERGMVDDGSRRNAFKSKIEAKASTIAVASSGELGDSLSLQGIDYRFDKGCCSIGHMLWLEPSHEVESRTRVHCITWQRISIEEIRDDDLEAIEGKIVCEKLTVDEIGTEHVRQEEKDFVFGIVDGGGCNVGSNTSDLLKFACGCTLMANARDAVLAKTHDIGRIVG